MADAPAGAQAATPAAVTRTRAPRRRCGPRQKKTATPALPWALRSPGPSWWWQSWRSPTASAHGLCICPAAALASGPPTACPPSCPQLAPVQTDVRACSLPLLSSSRQGSANLPLKADGITLEDVLALRQEASMAVRRLSNAGSLRERSMVLAPAPCPARCCRAGELTFGGGGGGLLAERWMP
jgi:hypothetical protein